jgi:hydroxyacylglutathione hydrolase
MNLYDLPRDVVFKALRGLGMEAGDAASQARIPLADVLAVGSRRARVDLEEKLGPVLGLDPGALAGLRDYRPELPPCEGLEQVELPFGDESVNVWILRRDGTVLIVDAGFGPLDLAAALDARGIDRCHLLVTHGHRDHVGGIAAVRRRLESFHAPGALEGAAAAKPGRTLRIGPFDIGVCDLRGHHPQAVGYRVDGLPRPLLAVGDALFAGSMGGCPNPEAFRLAMRTLRESVLPLAPGTILLTGHGPGSTLAQELGHNPFLAGRADAAGSQ